MRETYRIPIDKLKDINRNTDHLVDEMLYNMITHGVVFHDERSNVDYVVKEVQIGDDPLTLERIVEFDIKIVEIYGEYKEVERPSLMQYLGVKDNE